jgi:UDPglucose 6-dehydrogenase
MQEIVIIGVGYVGLVTGTCLAEMGNRVYCLDKNQEKIEMLLQGNIPIYEPGLEEMVRRNLKAGRLRFTSDYSEALKEATICFIAVDTPIAFDGSCDLRSIDAAAWQIGQTMSGDLLVVNKSTVPVGSAKRVKEILSSSLQKRQVSFAFDVVSNPEFLKEGSAICDFMKPDRVVIGAENEASAQIMRDLYRPFMLGSDRLLIMDPQSAELTKYAANFMLALRISCINWLSGLCEETGANILEVRKGIGSDKRIGNAFLWAGVGFGGSCFPKDILALKAMASKERLSTSLVDAVEEINTSQKKLLGKKILAYFEERGGSSGRVVGILGLAFKPDTDDIRHAPSLTLIQQLLLEGIAVRLFDPFAMENAKKVLGFSPLISWCESEIEVAVGADAIALVTEWKQFRLLDFETMLSQMKGNAFFDGRNQYTPQDVAKLGFDYISIGQAPAFATVPRSFHKEQEALCQPQCAPAL